MTTKARLRHQKELELLYSKNQLIPRIKEEFVNCKSFDFPRFIRECDIPEDFGIALLVQMALHKRTSLETLIGILRHHFNDSQETADMILKAAACDLVDYSSELNQFIVRYTITDDVQKELDQFQFPLPMVIRPKRVDTNKDTGYLLNHGHGSIILKDNHHMDDVCLDHINRVNRIRLTINEGTAFMIKNRWKNLDKPKEGESRDDFKRRKKAFEKYDSTALDVIKLLIQEGNMFYMTHKYDKRGRVYCQGYHVNYQGNPWNKAVIEFADKEIVE